MLGFLVALIAAATLPYAGWSFVRACGEINQKHGLYDGNKHEWPEHVMRIFEISLFTVVVMVIHPVISVPRWLTSVRQMMGIGRKQWGHLCSWIRT